jgi:hypothetical protein
MTEEQEVAPTCITGFPLAQRSSRTPHPHVQKPLYCWTIQRGQELSDPPMGPPCTTGNYYTQFITWIPTQPQAVGLPGHSSMDTSTSIEPPSPPPGIRVLGVLVHNNNKIGKPGRHTQAMGGMSDQPSTLIDAIKSPCGLLEKKAPA